MKQASTIIGKISIIFILLFSFPIYLNCQTIQFGIFNVNDNLLVKVKPSDNYTTNKLTDVVFTIRWLNGYGFSLGNLATDYGITKAGPEYTFGIYSYQKFMINDISNINWSVNLEYQIVSIIINKSGTGSCTFELSPAGFPSDNSGDPYIEIDLKDHTNYTTPFYQSTTTAALPVELTSFTSEAVKSGVLLKWQTSNELNNYGFEIIREVTAKNNPKDVNEIKPGNWTKVGFVQGNGNCNSPKEYSYVDKNPGHGVYINYRLKQIDNNGEAVYSQVTTVKLEQIRYELLQNYPNPFNPSTKICYSIAEACKVRIRIINLLGEVVKTIEDADKEAGYYEINFNGLNMSSGIYFYKIEAKNYSEIKKMMLLK